MTEVTYIYALLDPRTECVRYVGKTNDPARRLRAHTKLRRGWRRSKKSVWVGELKSWGQLPVMVLLQAVPLSCWKHAEMLWIDRFRRLGADLLNQSDGGDGPAKKEAPLPKSLVVQALQAMAAQVQAALSDCLREEYDVEWPSPCV